MTLICGVYIYSLYFIVKNVWSTFFIITQTSSSQQALTYRWQASHSACFRKVVATRHVLLESLQKLLQLGDDLCVHCLHEGLEALFPQDLLLGLELLIDELLQ